MANITPSSWQQTKGSSQINMSGSSSQANFNINYISDRMAHGKLYFPLDVTPYKTITLKQTSYGASGICDGVFGVFNNTNAPGNSDGDRAGNWKSLSSGSRSVNIDVSGTSGTKYIGFDFYGNSYRNDYGAPSCTIKFSAIEGTLNSCTITFNANGGTGGPDSQIVNANTNVALSTSKPTRANSVTSATPLTITGNTNGGTPSTTSFTIQRQTTTVYTFKGWAKSSTATTAEYQPGGTINIDSNITLYAVWGSSSSTVNTTDNKLSNLPSPSKNGSNISINFNANGGSPTPSTINASTKMAFKGWSSSSTGTTVLPPSTTFNANTTVYAVWGPQQSNPIPMPATSKSSSTYTTKIFFDVGEGTTPFPTQDLIQTTRYTFIGWKGTNNIIYYYPSSPIFSSSMTLTAQYDIGLQIESVIVPVAMRSGYTLLGYSVTGPNGAVTYKPGDLYTNTAYTTLYAVWEKGGSGTAPESGTMSAYIKKPGQQNFIAYEPYIYYKGAYVPCFTSILIDIMARVDTPAIAAQAIAGRAVAGLINLKS